MEVLIDVFKTVFTPLFTLILGSVLTYIFSTKTKKNETALKNKEEQYAKLLVKLQGFVGQTANGQTKKEFFEEQYKSWLYSSDEVIIAINDMIALVKKHQDIDPEEGRKAVGNIVVAMRKDLYGNTKLKYDSFVYTDVIGRK